MAEKKDQKKIVTKKEATPSKKTPQQARAKEVKKVSVKKTVKPGRQEKPEKKEVKKIAIIKLGGLQYKVKEGDVLEVNKLALKEGETFDVKEVLLVAEDGDVKIGTPILENVKIEAKVISELKGPKLIAFKYKPKKGYRRKKGFRSKLSKIEILAIKTS